MGALFPRRFPSGPDNQIRAEISELALWVALSSATSELFESYSPAGVVGKSGPLEYSLCCSGSFGPPTMPQGWPQSPSPGTSRELRISFKACRLDKGSPRRRGAADARIACPFAIADNRTAKWQHSSDNHSRNRREPNRTTSPRQPPKPPACTFQRSNGVRSFRRMQKQLRAKQLQS